MSRKLQALNKKLVEINEKYTGKILSYPRVYTFDTTPSPKKRAKYTIVAYYDAGCSVCFEQLSKWKQEIEIFKKANANINFRFILHTEDELITKAHLEHVKFPLGYITIDKTNDFLTAYNFISDKAFNTFLINSDDEILFTGSPLISKKIKEIYLTILRES